MTAPLDALRKALTLPDSSGRVSLSGDAARALLAWCDAPSCDDCGRSFANPNDLHEHRRVAAAIGPCTRRGFPDTVPEG